MLDGCNIDDLGDHRPGRAAAAEHRVRSPLIEAGLSKAEIRELSRQRGLPTWDKPAMACLSSRIPYGTPVTVEALDQIGAAEAFLRGLGFRQLRVRHHGDVARIEVEPEDLAAVIERRDRIVTRLKNLGYRYVTLDLAGFRSGSMNEGIARAALQTPSPPVPAARPRLTHSAVCLSCSALLSAARRRARQRQLPQYTGFVSAWTTSPRSGRPRNPRTSARR